MKMNPAYFSIALQALGLLAAGWAGMWLIWAAYIAFGGE